MLKPLGSADEDYNVIGLNDRWDWLRRPFFQLAVHPDDYRGWQFAVGSYSNLTVWWLAAKRKPPLRRAGVGHLSVIPLGLEPRTPTLKVLCSSQLSYGIVPFFSKVGQR